MNMFIHCCIFWLRGSSVLLRALCGHHIVSLNMSSHMLSPLLAQDIPDLPLCTASKIVPPSAVSRAATPLTGRLTSLTKMRVLLSRATVVLQEVSHLSSCSLPPPHCEHRGATLARRRPAQEAWKDLPRPPRRRRLLLYPEAEELATRDGGGACRDDAAPRGCRPRVSSSLLELPSLRSSTSSSSSPSLLLSPPSPLTSST